MSTKKIIILPDSFNLERHITQFPPEQYGFRSSLRFNIDKAYYFLGLITSIPERNHDIVTEDGFTPINQGTVRDGDKERGIKSIKDIKQYIDYLINTGVILRNNMYIVGKKSYGYKWATQDRICRFFAKIIDCKYADDINRLYAKQYADYPYLFHWYQQNRLAIYETAEDYAFHLYQEKMNDSTKESWDLNNKGEKKNPESQYRSAIMNIAKIKNCLYEAHIDYKVHRLHSAFTGLGKKYRRFVTYDGERLVGIDIKNSQPYITSLILNKEFWSFESSLPLSINTLSPLVRSFLLPLKSILYSPVSLIDDYFNSVEESDFTEYKNMVSSGRFYEKIVEIVRGLGETITRDKAKILMFYTIYSSNRLSQDPFLKQMKNIFIELFPQVAKLFKIIKREFKMFSNIEVFKGRQHFRLALLLQSIESQIILHKCCKRIWEEGNHQVPIFTIHDNIVTTVGNENFVTRIMQEEFERYIGIAPPLSPPEIWE